MLTTLSRSFLELRNDRRGVTALEYGLLAALIAIALISALTAFSGKVQNLFNGVGNTVNNVVTS
ncbi:MAG: Flp family type IVb pilin [Rhodospirillales bacterium]|nr:Flp family type IVb pilin [Rhodospirillales bacterium]